MGDRRPQNCKRCCTYRCLCGLRGTLQDPWPPLPAAATSSSAAPCERAPQSEFLLQTDDTIPLDCNQNHLHRRAARCQTARRTSVECAYHVQLRAVIAGYKALEKPSLSSANVQAGESVLICIWEPHLQPRLAECPRWPLAQPHLGSWAGHKRRAGRPLSQRCAAVGSCLRALAPLQALPPHLLKREGAQRTIFTLHHS